MVTGLAERKRVILFLNDNVSGAVISSYLVPKILEMGVEPVLFLLKPQVSEKAKIPELAPFAFYDGKIGTDTIFPFHEAHKGAFNDASRPLCLAPRHLAAVWGLDYQEIEDIHTNQAMNTILKDSSIIGGISIRNMQIFKESIISLFAEKKAFFWNLHGGLLPQYRGVHPQLWAMSEGEKKCGWTLHEIDQGIDTGPILGSRCWPLELKEAYLTEFFDPNRMDTAVQLTMQHLTVILSGRSLIADTDHQMQGPGRYHTFPTSEQIQEMEGRGVRFSDPSKQLPIYMHHFAPKEGPLVTTFRAAVARAIDKFEEERPALTLSLAPLAA